MIRWPSLSLTGMPAAGVAITEAVHLNLSGK
jgi:hypothetical protein